jgi:DNA-binding response OmpR family regulator
VASAGMIVLAEDDPRLRKLYSDTLTATGFHVFAASDGAAALELLSKVTPKLVLLDIMMPGMNGIDTCKRARGIVGDDVPIIFLSALDRIDILRDCVAAGGDDYMIKSDSLKDLVERIKQWARKGGKGQLAGRRKQMLTHVATVIDGGGNKEAPEEMLTSDNNEDVRAISAFVDEARMQAGEKFGLTVPEKLHLIGYVTGNVEHWTETKGTLNKNFNDYLRGVLRETGILTDTEVVDMVAAFAELSKDRSFTGGREHGRNDPIKRQRDGDSYIPNGLAAFKAPAEKSQASG